MTDWPKLHVAYSTNTSYNKKGIGLLHVEMLLRDCIISHAHLTIMHTCGVGTIRGCNAWRSTRTMLFSLNDCLHLPAHFAKYHQGLIEPCKRRGLIEPLMRLDKPLITWLKHGYKIKSSLDGGDDLHVSIRLVSQSWPHDAAMLVCTCRWVGECYTCNYTCTCMYM